MADGITLSAPNELASMLLTGAALPSNVLVTPYYDYISDQRYLDRSGFPHGVAASVCDGEGRLTHHHQGVIADRDDSPPVTAETLFFIGSISKMFIAATVLRMTEEVEYQPYLPQGVDTPVADLLPILRAKFPKVAYLDEDGALEQKIDAYNEKLGKPMTIRALAQHRAGLEELEDAGQNTGYTRFRAAQDKPVPLGSTLDWEQTVNHPEPGTFSYSNPGFQVLGAILSAIDHDMHPDQNAASGYGPIVRRLVLDKIKLERTFIPDEIETSGDGLNRSLHIKNRPDVQIALADDYFNGQLQRSQLFKYFTLGAGGISSCPDDLTQFAQAFFSDDPDKSLFKEQATRTLRDAPPPEISNQLEYYAMGHGVKKDVEGNIIERREHMGGEWGYHGALQYAENGAAAVVTVVYSTLIPQLAHTRMQKELGDKAPAPGTSEWQTEILKRSEELKRDYTQDQLISMRQRLEEAKSYFPISWQERVGKNGTEGKTYLQVIAEGISGQKLPDNHR